MSSKKLQCNHCNKSRIFRFRNVHDKPTCTCGNCGEPVAYVWHKDCLDVLNAIRESSKPVFSNISTTIEVFGEAETVSVYWQFFDKSLEPIEFGNIFQSHISRFLFDDILNLRGFHYREVNESFIEFIIKRLSEVPYEVFETLPDKAKEEVYRSVLLKYFNEPKKSYKSINIRDVRDWGRKETNENEQKHKNKT
jgi:hypothetical protein